jgi:hypothetical protein
VRFWRAAPWRRDFAGFYLESHGFPGGEAALHHIVTTQMGDAWRLRQRHGCITIRMTAELQLLVTCETVAAFLITARR